MSLKVIFFLAACLYTVWDKLYRGAQQITFVHLKTETELISKQEVLALEQAPRYVDYAIFTNFNVANSISCLIFIVLPPFL
jgi:hypothetical protein